MINTFAFLIIQNKQKAALTVKEEKSRACAS